jgi:hypothetical protein
VGTACGGGLALAKAGGSGAVGAQAMAPGQGIE